MAAEVTAAAASAANGASLDWAVGSQLALRTTLGEEVKGTLFSYDRITNCLVLTSPGSHVGSVSYRFLKVNCIKEICSALPSSADSKMMPLLYVDLEESANREERAVRALAMEEAPSVEDIETGQKMLSKLSKRWSCHWEGRNIVIEDHILLLPPYSESDFQAAKEYEGLVKEVKEMVVMTTPRDDVPEDG